MGWRPPEAAYETVSTGGRKALRLAAAQVGPGNRVDLLAIAGNSVTEVLASGTEDRMVLGHWWRAPKWSVSCASRRPVQAAVDHGTERFSAGSRRPAFPGAHGQNFLLTSMRPKGRITLNHRYNEVFSYGCP